MLARRGFIQASPLVRGGTTASILLLPPASTAAKTTSSTRFALFSTAAAAATNNAPDSSSSYHNNTSSASSSKSYKSLLTSEEGVHSNMKVSKGWRNKPLFRRQGDVRFKTGIEAAQLLIKEALRRDPYETEFITSITSNYSCLAPIFDRNPKYAFVAKTLMEPERFIQFRVSWIDDTGVIRMNRGWRIQYSSSLGPYEGEIHFGSHVNSAYIQALGFDAVFTNAITGFHIGAAVGGSDFHPIDKSESELQRFCQSYMTELVKYIGPDQDIPWMGYGVGTEEMGYLQGQFKRINSKSTNTTMMSGGGGGGSSSNLLGGRSFLSCQFPEAPGFAVVHFANEMLQDKGDSLVGKRCLILGADIVARTVAAKLLEMGAIPITFSDPSGHVYEPNGILAGHLKTINKIKNERGALLGRYIIASTTAQFNNPTDVFQIPCDLCFPCGHRDTIDAKQVDQLANSGCQGIIEGIHSAVTPAARKVLKKRGLLYGPHNMTMTGSAIVHGALGSSTTNELLAEHVARIYRDVKHTATEFNARGDLFAGANIMGFLRVAHIMLTHGAV